MQLSRRNFVLAAGASLASLVGLSSVRAADAPARRRRLAVLIAMPDDAAERNDQDLMRDSLRRIGYRADEILVHRGPAERAALLRFLGDVRERVRNLGDGEVFFHYTGSGWQEGNEVGLEMGQQHVTWNEVFDAIRLPAGVRMTLLPDCCFTNLLAGRLPARVSGLLMQAPPGLAICRAGYFTARTANGPMRYSRISYFAAHALASEQSLGQLAQRTNELMQGAVNDGRLRAAEAPRLVEVNDR